MPNHNNAIATVITRLPLCIHSITANIYIAETSSVTSCPAHFFSTLPRRFKYIPPIATAYPNNLPWQCGTNITKVSYQLQEEDTVAVAQGTVYVRLGSLSQETVPELATLMNL